MVAYFLRRILGGAIAWLLAAYLLFLIVITAHGLWTNAHCFDCGHTAQVEAKRLEISYSLDRIWPISYLTWVFGVGATGVLYTDEGHWNLGGYTPARTFQFERQGILVGDWGSSAVLEPSVPALQVYGIDLPTFLLNALTPTLVLMLIATLQRLDARPLRSLTFVQARELHGIRPLNALG
jgi:hypothetical protein